MSRIILLAFTFTGAMAVIGCTPDTKSSNSDNGGGSDDTGAGGGGDDGNTGEVQYLSIADIQQGTAQDGDVVVLEDVVVTSEFTQFGDGFFLQDQGGGPWSGIYVFMQGGVDGLFLSIGDKINVTGEVTEYYDWTELTVATTTAIEVQGETDVVVDSVDPNTTSDWESWESCLISVGAVTIGDVNQYGQADLGGGLLLDDLLSPVSATTGASYDEVIGLVGYTFEEWILAPREGDLIGYTPAAPVTIAEIQQDGLKGAYRIENVIATSVVVNDGDGFFIQDEGGGPWSGIYVYAYDEIANDIGLEVGKKYNLEASVSEYYGLTELVLQSLDNIEDVASGGPATATTDPVDASAVSDWEQWESCLISLGYTEATGEPDGYGQTALVGTDIYIDDRIYDYTTSEDVVTNGTTWTDVIGLVGQFQDSKSGDTTWMINPRTEADLVGYGEGDPPPDPTTATVVDIQTGVIAEGTEVTIAGAVVTSIQGSSGFFIQDLGGGEYSGVYVYSGGDDLGVSPGDVITITAETTEYYELTELVLNDAADVTLTGTDTVVADIVADAKDWEVWEGCHITVPDLEATSAPDEYGVTTLSNGLVIDDMIWFYHDEMDVAAGDSWASITGGLAYGYGAYSLNPSSSADFVAVGDTETTSTSK